ncbi:histidine--tRNA ligase [Buchnera aphidicola]|uniref:histidine--tRNA ligase n=1 Tax=Buchnera aphidicola TaxID=9 RepID=UPI002238B564|nr:histidine--tRNA ligase [Buchnera aphidicola]MCW5197692.1 histidine--tRNA ligase [Buchnera aphidicola (Chaitophorus viminalis)]
MIKKIKSIRGMHDYLPEELYFWEYTEKILKIIFKNYGYKEIRLPILEHTQLFKKSIGKVTDIIEKEMYTFFDNKKKSITLRPEATASCARAVLENNLLKNINQRFWYFGPMFRYERPQKCRYRQFYQFGCEVYGLSDPCIDLELIILLYRCWKNLKIDKKIFLEINSIGSIQSREKYKSDLKFFLNSNIDSLDIESRKRLYTNPLRILDSKNLNVQNLLRHGPVLLDYIDKNSKNHFKNLCSLIKKMNIPFIINKNLVRGLDYYNSVVFEWKYKSKKLGSQNTICAGGRYDNLINILGGPSTPALGFAIGMERLIYILRKNKKKINQNLTNDIYIISDLRENKILCIKYSEKIRNYFSKLKIIQDFNLGSIKKKIIRAKKFQSKIIIIINKYTLINNIIEIRYCNTNKIKLINIKKVITTLKKFFLK